MMRAFHLCRRIQESPPGDLNSEASADVAVEWTDFKDIFIRHARTQRPQSTEEVAYLLRSLCAFVAIPPESVLARGAHVRQDAPMKIEHFALQVPDPVAMAQWYVNHLGFSVARSGGE